MVPHRPVRLPRAGRAVVIRSLRWLGAKAPLLGVVLLAFWAEAGAQRTAAGGSGGPGKAGVAARRGVAAGPAPSAPYAPGEVLIKFRRGPRAPRHLDVQSLVGARIREQFKSGAEHWILPPGVGTEEAIARLRGDPDVEYVEPNYVVTVARVPDDPRYPELYGLHNTGQTGGTPGADIAAESAWNITTGSRAVRVAVIDTGIDYTHPDLAANIWSNPGEIPGNGLDDDGNGFVDDVRGWDFANHDNDPMDDAGHGTHVAGTIGAEGDNHLGVAGVSWRVSLVPLKFLGSDGSGLTADAVAAIDYATQMGVDIMSNSWGGGGFSATLLDAISAAGSAGILFVAAAGNRGENLDEIPFYPAGYDAPNIVSVAATDKSDHLASFSNYGAIGVDLAAPGVSILSTLPSGNYGLLSGTSMAAPHVAGAAAIIRAVAPRMGVAELKQRLLAAAHRVPELDGLTVSGGRLDAFLTIATADTVPPGVISDLAAEAATSGSVTLRWTATGDDGDAGRASTYDIRYATEPFDEAGFELATLAPGSPVPLPAGALERFEVPGLAPDTTYHFAIKAGDEWGNAGPFGNLVARTTLPAPTFSSAPGSFSVDLRSGQTATRTLTIENAGVGSLDWRILPILATLPGHAPSGKGGPGPLGVGGPDDFGYRFVDSDEVGGPDFVWNDIAATGTPILSLAGDDELSEAIPLGFSVSFYGNAYSSVRVSTNGFLTFTGDSSPYTNQPLPSQNAPPDLIAPFWDDLSFLGEHHAVYQRGDGEFTVQFTDVPRFAGPGSYTFQATIRITGEILFQYLSLSGTTQDATVGIQNGARNDGLMVAFDAPYLHDRLAVEIAAVPQWLAATPLAGRLFAGERSEVTLRMDATGLSAGAYESAVFVESNDPLRPLVRHPVVLGVTSAPAIAVAPAALDFGAVFLGTSKTIGLDVTNTGSEHLTVSRAASDDPAVTADPAAFTIPARSTRRIEVAFSPAALGALQTTLVLTSDASNAPSIEVPVTGLAALPPGIVVAPASFAETLYTGDTVTRSLRISNPGGSPLVVTFSALLPGAAVGAPGESESAALAAWLRIAPEGGTIGPGAFLDFAVTFDAGSLDPGGVGLFLRVVTNVPQKPTVRLGVTLTVVGAANVVLAGQGTILETARDYTTSGARTIHGLPVAVIPALGGTLKVTANGDYGLSSEKATVTAEGTPVGVLGGTGTDCGAATGTFTLDASRLAALAADGSLEFEVQNSAAVDPSCPTNRHTVRLEYTGAADRLDFGALPPGLGRQLGLVIENLGSEALDVTPILSDRAEFAPSETAIHVAARSARALLVRFTPAGPGPFEGALDLATNDPDAPRLSVALRGAGATLPALAAGPAALEATLPEGGRVARTLRLMNAGDAPVAFVLRAKSPLAAGPATAACASGRAYVAQFNGGEISTLDLATGGTVRLVADLFGPRALVLDASETTAYVTEYGGTLSAVDLATRAVRRIASGLGDPNAVALDAAGTTAFVTEFNPGALSAVDLATGIVRRLASGLGGPFGVAVNAAGTRAYVTESGSFTLAEVNLGTGQVTRFAFGLGTPLGVALDASETTAYVAGFSAGDLQAVDLTTGASRRVATGLGGPWGVALDADGTTAYVTESGTGALAAVDLASGTVRRVASGLSTPAGIVLLTPAACRQPFLSAGLSSGTVPAAGSLDVPLRFDAGHLPPGAYAAVITVSTAGPIAPILTVPASLAVEGASNLVLTGQEVIVQSAADYKVSGARTVHRLPLPAPPRGAGTLELVAEGDFDSPSETATVAAEGTTLGFVGRTRSECASAAGVFSLSATELAAQASDGAAEITVQNSPDVGAACALNRHTVRLRYPSSDPAAGVDFGPVFAGQLREIALTVGNNGSRLLEVSSIESDQPEFSPSHPALAVPPGASQSLTIGFRPPGAGVFRGTLRIASNDPDAPILDVDLSGTGLAPPVAGLEPAALSAEVAAGRQETRTLALLNDGGSPLEFSILVLGRPPLGAPADACAPARAFVSERQSGDLAAVDLGTGTLTRLASGLSGPGPLALGSTGTVAYAVESTGTLSVIDLIKGTITRLAPGLGPASGLALNATQTVAYVAGTGGTLVAVDLRTGVATAVASGLGGAEGLALDPAGRTAYVTRADPGDLLAIDLATGQRSVVAAGLDGPTSVAVDPRGEVAYVIESDAGHLVSVDLGGGATARVASGLREPTSVALADGRSLAYVTESRGTLVAVDLVSGQASSVAAGLVTPRGLALQAPAACSGAFLTVTPRSGAVPAHESVPIQVALRTAGLPLGTYRAVIEVASDDPASPVLAVAATLTVAVDVDGDGVPDASDDCPTARNPGQEDGDQDGRGDACDNCPATANAGQEDSNDDGSGDACQPVVSLAGIRQDGGETLEVAALARDPQEDPLAGSLEVLDGGGAPVLSIPFSEGLPRISPIAGLQSGTAYRLVITVTDGSTVPVAAEAPFDYRGESLLVVNNAPHAVAQAPALAECDRRGGGEVVLDGTASLDPDAGPDEIVAFDWSEDPGLASVRGLGTGAIVHATLAPGAHRIGLTVTDRFGESDTDTIDVAIQDTVPPALALPGVLSANATTPAGAAVPYAVQAEDRCAGAFAPDCHPPPGSTFPINAPGAVTTVLCRAVDPNGNAADGAFAVHVKGAAEQLRDLGSLIDLFHLPKGLAADLQNNLRAALDRIAAGRIDQACKKIQEFDKRVQEESAKHKPKIGEDQARQMRTAAGRIQSVLGCRVKERPRPDRSSPLSP